MFRDEALISSMKMSSVIALAIARSIGVNQLRQDFVVAPHQHRQAVILIAATRRNAPCTPAADDTACPSLAAPNRLLHSAV